MSYIIKGKDFPDCCYDCIHLDDSGDYDMCGITSRSQGYRFDSRNNKMKDCPLSEIPTPHGRLIDADEIRTTIGLMKAIESAMPVHTQQQIFDFIINLISNVATVIEAEE